MFTTDQLTAASTLAGQNATAATTEATTHAQHAKSAADVAKEMNALKGIIDKTLTVMNSESLTEITPQTIDFAARFAGVPISDDQFQKIQTLINDAAPSVPA